MRKLLLAAAYVIFSFLLIGEVYGQAATITVTAASGNIFACYGTASSSPNIQQITITGSGLTGNVTATAPTGFEVSLNMAAGYGNSVNIIPAGGIVAGTTVYVRSSASAPLGVISKNVTVSSPGVANQKVTVSATVNPLPTVDQPANQTVIVGTNTAAINFTGTGNTFTWTNDTPGIGLAASSTGDIGAFAAQNTTNHPITATITVTPSSAPYAYVTDMSNNNVIVINTITDKIVKRIPVGAAPIAVAISKDQSRVYICNEEANNISVIATSTNTVVATIPVGQSPQALVVSPDGKYLYVVNGPPASISVISVATNKIINSLPAIEGGIDLAISPDGTVLYMSGGLSSVASVNTVTGQMIVNANEGDYPIGIAVSHDGSKLYVANSKDNNVRVLNSATLAQITYLDAGTFPYGMTISPDGSKVYVSSFYSTNVVIIDVATDTFLGNIYAGNGAVGVCLTPDGRQLLVADADSHYVAVCDTKTNSVITTIKTGSSSGVWSMGNFITNGTGCSGDPVTFQITVNPVPAVTATQATSTITACQGTASASPNIQQFTVTGSNLTDNAMATAPAGFEVSLSATGGYGGGIILSRVNGAVNTTVYVRSAAADGAGNIAGNVLLTSPGAATQQVAVSGVVNALPVVANPGSQTFGNGTITTAIDFSGTADSYNWTNNTPAIGLDPSGTGDIPAFTAINTGSSDVIATIKVTPMKSTGCNGSPVSFTITISPTPHSVLSAETPLTGLTTVYGTASQGESFHVSGTDLTAGILITAPTGFEVSNDGVNYNTTTTINETGEALNIKIFIRLASTTPVGPYDNENIVLSAPDAARVNVLMPLSTVTGAPLTVTANDITKLYGTANPPLTVTYTGFVNNEDVQQLTKLPDVTTAAVTSSAVGQYPIAVGGAMAANYVFNYIFGVLTIEPASTIGSSTITIPNTFTPNGDGINDTWEIKNLENYPKAVVTVFNRWGQKVYSSVGYPVPWDGSDNGKILSAGTYYYMIDTKNGQPVISGWVAIIR